MGGDLAPGTLLAAYRSGVFPMGLGETARGRSAGGRPTRGGCCSRAGSTPAGRCASRAPLRHPGGHRLRRGRRARAPTPTARAGGSPRRSSTPTPSCTASAGRTASRRGSDGELVGGLYGLSIGGLFAGESMFHAPRTPPRSPSPRWRASSSTTAARTASSTSSGARRTCAASASWSCPAGTTSRGWPRLELRSCASPGRRRSSRPVDLAAAGASGAPGTPRGHRPRRPPPRRRGTRGGAAGTRRGRPPVRPGRWPRARARPSGASRAAWASRMTGSGQRRPLASTTTGTPRPRHRRGRPAAHSRSTPSRSRTLDDLGERRAEPLDVLGPSGETERAAA